MADDTKQPNPKESLPTGAPIKDRSKMTYDQLMEAGKNDPLVKELETEQKHERNIAIGKGVATVAVGGLALAAAPLALTAGGLGAAAEAGEGAGILSRVASAAKKVGSLAKKAGALDIAYQAGEMMGGGEGGGGTTTESSGSGGGLGGTAKRARGAAGYSPLEMSILRSEGITSQGWWLGREGKSVKRDEVESTLKDSPFTVIIKKLDILNSIVSKLLTEITQVKNISREQLELNQKIYDSMAIAKAEEGGVATVSPVERKSATVEKIKATAKDAMKDFLKTFAAGLIPLLAAIPNIFDKFGKNTDTRPKQYAGQTLAKDGTLSELQMRQAEFETKRGTVTPDIAEAYDRTKKKNVEAIYKESGADDLPQEYKDNKTVQNVLLERHTIEFKKKFVEQLIEHSKKYSSRSEQTIVDAVNYSRIQANKTEDIKGIGGFIKDIFGVKQQPKEAEQDITRESTSANIPSGKAEGGAGQSVVGPKGQEGFITVMRAAEQAGDKFPEVTAAQWALESGYGKSPSGKNNFFGQKAKKGEGSSSVMTTEVINGQTVKMAQQFKDYATPEEGVADHVKKWSSKYASANTPEEAVSVLARNGYATDPQYTSKIISIIKSNSSLIAENKTQGKETQVASAETGKTSAAAPSTQLAAATPTAPASATPATPTAPAPAAPTAATPATPAPTAPTVIAMNTPAKQPAAPSTQFETPAPAHPYSQEDEYAVYFNIFDKMGIPSFA
jgi:flagellum-specific peptidoglycan hydrolase FlgJ